MSRQTEFIEKLAPMVVAEAKCSKILPSMTIAQACLETGYGKHLIGGNALFGIKGKGTVTTTKEYINGEWITIKDSFRDYNSWEESIADHSEFIHTVKVGGKLRYKAVIGETDYKKACRAIFAAGYATGKDYDRILISIVETYKLYEYDKQAVGSFGSNKATPTHRVRVGNFKRKSDADNARQAIINLKFWDGGCTVEPSETARNEWQVNVQPFETEVTAKAAKDKILRAYGWYCEVKELRRK